MLEYGQRLQRRARNLLAGSDKSTGRVLFEVALTGGARALGVPGGIALGAPADVISLNVEHVSARTAPGPFQRGRCATRC